LCHDTYLRDLENLHIAGILFQSESAAKAIEGLIPEKTSHLWSFYSFSYYEMQMKCRKEYGGLMTCQLTVLHRIKQQVAGNCL
jgi:hypothetical protein